MGWTAKKCYTSSPQCVPARLSWITGLWPSEIGITENLPVDLPANSPSIIRDLQQAGWTTGIVGKTHWSNHNKIGNIDDNKARLKGLGFDKSIEIVGPRALQKIECEITRDWRRNGIYEDHMQDLRRRYGKGRTKESWKVRESVLPNELYPDIWITNKAIEMLDEMPTHKPWLLWVSYVGPHEPFDTPRPWKGIHKNIRLENYHEDNGWIKRLQRGVSLKNIYQEWEGKLEKKDIIDLRIDYADNLALLDEQTTRLLDAAEQRRDSTNTAIAITADHGEMLGDHNLLYKSTFLEGSIRVPFIYKPPLSNGKINKIVKKKELNLSKLLKILIENLKNGGKIDRIEAWSNKQKGAIIEFRDETMFIMKGTKVAYNHRKEKIWATDIKSDPNETKNLLEERLNKKQEKKLMKVEKWAGVQLQKRTADKWNKLKLQKTIQET